MKPVTRIPPSPHFPNAYSLNAWKGLLTMWAKICIQETSCLFSLKAVEPTWNAIRNEVHRTETIQSLLSSNNSEASGTFKIRKLLGFFCRNPLLWQIHPQSQKLFYENSSYIQGILQFPQTMLLLLCKTTEKINITCHVLPSGGCGGLDGEQWDLAQPQQAWMALGLGTLKF